MFALKSSGENHGVVYLHGRRCSLFEEVSNQCGAVGTVVIVRPAGGTFLFDSCVGVRGIAQSGDCVSLACSVFVVSCWVGRWD